MERDTGCSKPRFVTDNDRTGTRDRTNPGSEHDKEQREPKNNPEHNSHPITHRKESQKKKIRNKCPGNVRV
jgi:hypothetical protein